MNAEPAVPAAVPGEIADWFAGRGWRIRRHQLEMLEKARAGRDALLVADTGAGKTLAGFLPTLCDFAPSALAGKAPPGGLHTLYVSPLKALAHDVKRNLLIPVEEMGLPLRVETRSGDTSSDAKKRQRQAPPHVLLTTPESLSLLLSYPESLDLFEGLQRIVIDEIHAFATGKRGDLLALALARLHGIAPGARRAALSATLANPLAFREWLAPQADDGTGEIRAADLVLGEKGAEPDVEILLPIEERVPWGGHAGRWAVGQLYEAIKANRTTLVFTNTRFLAEFIFQCLWEANEDHLPIGVHHGSLSKEARRRVEDAMAAGELRALVCTASLDLGVDWGDIDLVVQMGAPKGSSRLLQRIGRAGHRLDTRSRAVLVPGNRFEFLEAMAAKDAVDEGQRDGEEFRPGGLDVLAQHVMACACAGPFHEDALLAEIRTSLAYAWLGREEFARVLSFVESGGYALKAYDRFKRIVRGRDGTWRLAHAQQAQRHRMNAGIIVDSEMLTVRFRNGRSLGKVEERFAAQLAAGDTFFFAGMSLEVESVKDMDVIVRAAKKSATIPSYGGLRLPLTTHLAERVQAMLTDRAGWSRFPDDVREWLEMQDYRSRLPAPGELLVESFPHAGKHYSAYYTFEGWNANQSLGMLITRRMEDRGLLPGGFVANDYCLAVWGLKPVRDPAPLLSPDILTHEFTQWVTESHLLRRAFREVAVISGLVERQHPGRKKTGKQVTFSTDLIYDVLRKYEPDHVLLEAAWADARARMTDVGRLADLLERSERELVHVELDRVSPLAVPVMTMIGREAVPQGAVDDELLIEAEALVAEAMRIAPGEGRREGPEREEVE
ncbi:ligase-associated DNA damage response DEXH box helicase [Erythrobacter sp. HL-111]|uniref:ligase-associated DNA damage response DEXH box helicase n=1 Tax=Erythrobacter sp. HL-111 TaxID=1798193 RepID=UPI0006DAF825|nr:ligase-associated DNA damage response DEXH box helicase [Erythrobacter sp. HL-111]KPP94157.1 MAG: DEXH box helicase, DNA ligase-associated [Erythrobacteraceae bacterium HL-111]SDS65374.1 ATP-dependent helicase Lhr and Lhr-like helicase [Erythrobacter sp. HL-111]